MRIDTNQQAWKETKKCKKKEANKQTMKQPRKKIKNMLSTNIDAA